MSNTISNTTDTNYAHYKDYDSYIADATATSEEVEQAFKKISSQSLPSALNEGLKYVIDHINDSPIVTPVTLADWREYVNDPDNQNTHATISGSSVVAAPDTWHGHVITFLFRMSQEDVAKSFQQAVTDTVQNEKITQFIFNAALQERAQTSQPAILLQKALNAAIAAAIPVLNTQLKKITLTATPEQHLNENASLATTTSSLNSGTTTNSSSPAASRKYFPFFQTNLQEKIIKSIQESLANSIVDTAVDRGVSRAIDQLNGMSVSMELDPKATIELTSGKQNSMVDDVLTCFQQTLNAGIKAAIPIVNAWSKVQISLTLPDSDKAPTPILPKDQRQNVAAPAATSSDLQQPQPASSSLKPLVQYCVDFPQTLQETIVETLDKTLVGQITDEAVDRGITRALQQLSGVTIGVQIDPKTKAPIGGVTHELVKDVIDTTDTLIGTNLARVVEAAKGIKTIASILELANRSSTATEPVAETDEAARTINDYANRVGYNEQKISIAARESISNDPLTTLLKTINEEGSTIAAALNTQPLITLDQEAIQIMQQARVTMAQVSKLITQTLLPHERAIEDNTPDLPIETLKDSLAPLLKQLESHLELLKKCALNIAQAEWEVVEK